MIALATLLLLISILLIAILALAFQWIGFITGLLILGAFIIFASMYLQTGFIVLNEMEVGVIFNKRNGNFAYFIDSNVKGDTDQDPNDNNRKVPINKYAHETTNNLMHKGFRIFGFPIFEGTKYRHYIDPFTEELTDKITRGSYKGEGEIEVRTKEGIPVEIDFAISFKLDVQKILAPPHLMARALPQNAGNMVKGKAMYALHHIIEDMGIVELYKDGAVKKLEEDLRKIVLERTKVFGVYNINQNNQVQIKSIKMPDNIERALKAAHQRKLQTETVTHALESLKNAIKDFNDTDMARLAELEKLRIVDENSAGLIYMMDSVVNKEPRRPVQQTNGNSNKNDNN